MKTGKHSFPIIDYLFFKLYFSSSRSRLYFFDNTIKVSLNLNLQFSPHLA